MTLKDYLEEGYDILLDANVKHQNPKYGETEIQDSAIWQEVALILAKMRYTYTWLEEQFEGKEASLSPPSLPDDELLI
ncbi:MAG: hypothetical protein AAGC85_15895 [Bacteroidota bacterium]